MKGSLGTLWRGAGGWLVLVCLAGLMAGLFREYLFPFRGSYPYGRDIIPAPLPTLETLTGSQVFFYLLVLPLVMAYRQDKQEKVTFRGMLIESLGFLLASVPFLLMAGFLGNADWRDGLRVLLAITPLIPLGYAAGILLHRPAFRTAVLLGLLLLVMVGPILIYLPDLLAQNGWPVMRETGSSLPLCFVWSNAASPMENVWPVPLWNWGLLWGISLATALLAWVKTSDATPEK